MKVIFDSGVWIAFLNKSDVSHKKAVDIFKRYEQKQVFLSEYLLLEITSVLTLQVGKKHADLFLEMVLNNQNIDILPLAKSSFFNFLNFFRSLKAENLSFVDLSLLFLSKDFHVITFDKELEKNLGTCW